MRFLSRVLVILMLAGMALAQTPPYNILNQPALTNLPYPNAYYSHQLPGAGSGGPLTHLMSGSAAMVTNSFAGITQTGPYHTPGSDDFSSFPIYYGQASDPVWTITGCAGNSTTAPAINGQTFHAATSLPYNGFPNGSSDSQIIIYDQVTQKTFIFYTFGAGQLPGTAGTFNHNGNIYCNMDNWTSGRGYQSGSLVTGGLSPFSGAMRIKELLAGQINHGLYGYSLCSGSANGLYPSLTVFPIGPDGGSPGQTCAAAGTTDTNRPPNGALVFLDYTTAQLNCFDPSQPAITCTGVAKLGLFQFAIVRAATLYGITIGGTGNGDGVALPSIESETSYAWLQTHGYPGAQAIADQFTTAMNTACVSPCSVVTRSAPHSLRQWNTAWWANISSVNGQTVFQHMHIADPCVTLGMQGLPGGCVSGTSPAVTLNPTSISFGTQAVSSPSSVFTATLVNSGTATLTISSKVITGTNTADFSETDTCGVSLGAGANCTFSVTFTPHATGARSAAITITDNASGSPHQLGLVGTGGSTAVTLNPTSINFGTVATGSCSAVSTSTITNSGTSNVSLTGLTFTGTNVNDFPIGNTGSCPGIIAPVATTYTTSFPTVENPISEGGAWTNGGTVGLGWTNIIVNTAGKAIGTETAVPNFTDSTATLQYRTWANDQRAFGTVFTNGAPTINCAQEVEARLRTTISPNSITGYEVDYSTSFGNLMIVRWNGPVGNFTVLATAPNVVAHNGDVIKGTVVGNVITAYINGVQMLQTTDNTYTSGYPGMGINYAPFTGCTGAERNNYGFTNFTAEEVTPAGGSGTLAPGASCTQSAKFCPLAAGARTASMNFVDNAPGSPQGVALSGVGGASAVGLSPTSAACGSHQVGTSSTCQAFTVTNTGNVTLSAIVVSLNGTNSTSFSQSNNCPATIAPTGTCAITVFFNPATSGTQSANLAIASNSPSSPTLAALTGTGTLPAAITLAPQSVNFGSVLVGTTTSATPITLTNNGGTAVTISSIVATSPFGDTHNCPISPITLGSGLNCTINATATPIGTGVANGTITVTDDAPGSPHIASLSVTGTAPTANLSPATVPFGNQTVGTTSSASTVVLNNQGTGPLTISSITIGGTNSGDFSKTTTCSTTVSPGASCTIAIVFNPAGAGSRSASLSVATNAPGSPSTASLTGTGIATTPAVCLNPSSINFSNQSVGTSSGSRATTVTNCGTAILTISSVTTTGNFSQTNTCASIAPNATCTINGVFSPASAGSLVGHFSITSNAASSPDLIQLSGFGTQTGATITSTASFGHVIVGVTSPGITLSLVNTGNTSLALNAPTITGANPGDFSFVSNCGSNLAANATCTLSVTFSPSTTGARSASFNQSFTGGGAAVTSSLTGTGDAAVAALTFSPTTIDFGSVQTGVTSAAKIATINSVGNVALAITSITLTGTNAADYTITNNACGSSQPIGGFCTVSITVNPSGVGTRIANLHVIDNAPDSPQDLPLTTDGVATPTPQVSLPASLNFSPPSIQTGFTSAAQIATLVNTGNADLHVSSVTLGGANPGDYILSNNCSTVIAGSSCSATVNCMPTVAGSRTAAAIFTSDASTSPDSVALSCTGFIGTPNITLAVSTINFGNQIVGTVSSPVIFTLSNIGLAMATGVTITAIGDFSVTDTCGGSIAVSGSCSATVTFSPAILCGQFGADGVTCISNVHPGQISVVSNTSNSPQTVSLQGTAVPVPPPLGPVIIGMGGHTVVGGRIHVGVH